MTCQDCIYEKMCESRYEREHCLSFKDKANFIEVVRCKDCKYCFHYIRPNYERYECTYEGCSDEVVDYVEPTHYCSYGEKNTD